MFRPLALFIGLRYTKTKKSNRMISLTALISMVGLVLGVMVLITVLSVMNGFDKELKSRILGAISQASVTSLDTSIADWQNLVLDIETDTRVASAAPFIHLQGMLSQNAQVAGVLATGIVPEYEKDVSIIESHMLEGSLDALQPGSFGIVLGQTLAQSMGVGVGDKVTLVLPEASASPAGVIPRFKRFDVVGVFNVSSEIDSALAFLAMEDAAVMLKTQGAQGIRMRLYDIFQAREVADAFASRYMDLYPDDWTRTHGNLFGAIQMEKAMVGLLLFLIIIVAAFNIVSSLVMVVTEKTSDIAILKTFGASKSLIAQVFVVQGMIIGVIGTLVGTTLGVGLSLTISPILEFVSRVFGLSLFDAYFINYLPSDLRWEDVVIVASTSFMLSFVMTIYPALKAANTLPAQTLRYE